MAQIKLQHRHNMSVTIACTSTVNMATGHVLLRSSLPENLAVKKEKAPDFVQAHTHTLSKRKTFEVTLLPSCRVTSAFAEK